MNKLCQRVLVTVALGAAFFVTWREGYIQGFCERQEYEQFGGLIETPAETVSWNFDVSSNQ
ncbi:hypothetical protein [Rubinisphaera margarita]|uniref:hypothetical protein n=1 Tax=Rubinisphaera margarita TaxID=2909586 RepID=UPI001EE88D19|nr:hypothetical protein [Rubinisphaera margarita]MCG6155569.1 hypothetical protein [Rubinisphaera margarita]